LRQFSPCYTKSKKVNQTEPVSNHVRGIRP
jgi:hypothetical protein